VERWRDESRGERGNETTVDFAPGVRAQPGMAVPHNDRSGPLRGARVEISEGVDDAVLVGVGQFGIDGKRESFLAGSFGDRKLSRAIAEVGKRLLEVKAERVVDFGGNASEAQRFF